jgi:hypothetical protein
MSGSISSSGSSTAQSAVAPTRLWTPRVIAVATFLFGFPSGITLAALNWRRMGLGKKALLHLAVALIGAVITILLIFESTSGIGRPLGLIVNFGVLFYLNNQMQRDITKFEAENHFTENDNWLIGGLIALGVAVLYLAIGVFIALLSAVLGSSSS